MNTMGASGNGHQMGSLPEPRLARFEPLRAGIAGLWQYDDQEFWFHHGRLMLRGENGMGKSKALELLLPFLFDADLRPERLDPFGERSRGMRWNLVGDDQGSGLGYSWLEFGRIDDPGGARFLTIGAGMRATRSADTVDRWFFVCRGRRGLDFELFDEARVPHTKDRLKEELGDLGRVLDSKDEYRRAVDAELFGLGSERYGALIELLLQLRRPQLSKTLDPAELSKLLTTSLPPLDEAKIDRLADALEQLERLDDERTALEKSHSLLTAFLHEYRAYAVVEARRLGAPVRTGASRLYEVTRKEKEAHADLRRAAEDAVALEGQKQANADAVAAAGAERAVLEDSEEMRSARELERLNHAARAAVDHESMLASLEQEARARLEAARGKHGVIAAQVERAEAEADSLTASARRVAAEAGMSARHEAHEAALRSDPEGARHALLAVIEDRRTVLTALRGLIEELHDVQRIESERRRNSDDAAAALADGWTALDTASAETEAAKAALVEGLIAWRASLRELSVPDEIFAALVGDPPSAGAGDLLLEAQRIVADEIAATRERLAIERTRSCEAHDDLCDERRLIADEHDDGPPALHPRPWRVDVAGAPLWRLCEFRDHLTEEQQAGLEAALEDSGLLDAWVTPEGRVMDDTRTDVFLVSAPLPGPTLLDALAPVTGAPVAPPVIEAVLASIALDGDAQDWVAYSGRWALGPLTGRASKPAALHIGVAARERARAQRLSGLDRRISEHLAAIAELDRARDEVEARAERLRFEYASVPSSGRLLETWRAEESLRGRVNALELAAAEALERLEQATAARHEAIRVLSDAAERAGVSPDPARIQELMDALLPYKEAALDLARALTDLSRAEEGERALGAEIEKLEADLASAAERLSDAHARTVSARSRAEAAESLVGAGVADVLARLDGIRSREVVLRRDAQALSERDREIAMREATAREKLRTAEADRGEREAERDRSVLMFRTLLDGGLLGLAMPDLDAGQGYNATRALDVARRVLNDFGDEPDPDEVSRAQSSIWNFFTQVRNELASDIEIVAEQIQGLFLVHMDADGRRREVIDFVEFLEEELGRRRADFEVREREVIESFLIKELGVHLQERIEDARVLVARMNDQLRSHPTASGVRITLRWRPNELDAESVGGALRLLRKDLALMTDGEMDALVRFLRRRIALAREDERAGRYAEHLAAALDHRRWHTFEIIQEKDGRQEILTKKRHAQGSGGERSVALHLPLFAAAAAHYSSAADTAPRVIMLDEAFAGIDQGMRASCLGLLQGFDLDVLMTSHEEWGFYPEIDGLATYQLARDPRMRGVAATRFVWNGHTAIEEGYPQELTIRSDFVGTAVDER